GRGRARGRGGGGGEGLRGARGRSNGGCEEGRDGGGDGRDRRVLSSHEGAGALLDRPFDFLHPLVPAGEPEHAEGEVRRRREGGKPGNRNHRGETDHPPPPQNPTSAEMAVPTSVFAG